jgi:hypothetical protein
MGGSAIAGPPIFLFCGGIFLSCGGLVFLLGVLQKSVVLLWCFGGVNVVL